MHLPIVIKIGIIHYQLETIHPFLDGNGRVGRLLIALQLVESKILIAPTLYLSAFFEKNKSSYYDSLSMVRQNNDLEQWIKFFLNGIIDSASDCINTFKNIIDLRLRYEQKILSLGVRAKNAQKLINYMFLQPIVSSKLVQENVKIGLNTSNRLLKSLIDLQILEEVTGHSRNRLYVLRDYLNLFKK